MFIGYDVCIEDATQKTSRGESKSEYSRGGCRLLREMW